MSVTSSVAAGSRSLVWTGRVLSSLAILFLLVDGVTKIIKLEPVMEVSAKLDVPAETIPGLGVTLVACTLIYAFPPTALVGAILLTGYLGGAVWTHVRVSGEIFPIVFPFLVAALVWGGLYLRDPDLRRLIPRRMNRP